MSQYSGQRLFLAGVVTVGLTLAASATGLPGGLFLAGVFAGGILTAAVFSISRRAA